MGLGVDIPVWMGSVKIRVDAAESFSNPALKVADSYLFILCSILACSNPIPALNAVARLNMFYIGKLMPPPWQCVGSVGPHLQGALEAPSTQEFLNPRIAQV